MCAVSVYRVGRVRAVRRRCCQLKAYGKFLGQGGRNRAPGTFGLAGGSSSEWNTREKASWSHPGADHLACVLVPDLVSSRPIEILLRSQPSP